MRLATVEIYASEHSFSAGHFTIFSATEREDLHGHNYNVSLKIQGAHHADGLSFDYRIYKKKIAALCEKLDRRFLLPSQSRYLKLIEDGTLLIAKFGAERIPFLHRDVLVLPIANVTIEELAHWFLSEVTQDSAEIKKHGIQTMTVKVYNGPGQSGAATVTFN